MSIIFPSKESSGFLLRSKPQIPNPMDNKIEKPQAIVQMVSLKHLLKYISIVDAPSTTMERINPVDSEKITAASPAMRATIDSILGRGLGKFAVA